MQGSLENMNSEIYVIKRDGRREEVHFDKVQDRIKLKSNGLIVNPNLVAQRVCSRIYDGVSTAELDELAGQICTSLMTENPDYGILATRIVISNNHKTTSPKFSQAMLQLESFLSKTLLEIVKEKGDIIDAQIDDDRDYLIDYFGFKTLQKGYLLKIGDKIIERPQYLFMRVSLGLHDWDLENAFKSYNMLSKKYFCHATPTLFHSGTPHPQLLSCFLMGTEDSVDGIYKNISDCAKISKWAGGIGVHISNIRGRNAYIKSSNGKGNGIVPMLRVYNETAKYINQSGKRNGSIAIYLEPYHPDIMDFLDLRKNNGAEDARTRDLFLALMLPDLFMRRVEEAVKNPDKVINWSLFDPNKCPGLVETYGDAFTALYEKYENEGLAREVIDIGKLWKKIMSSQIETGTPYILYKDRINELSNQSNIGTIKSSNLCSEIVEYSDSKEYACCCLASISLGELVDIGKIDGHVKIYSKTNCPYCEKALELLPKDCEKIVLDDDDERKAFYDDLNKPQCEGEVCYIKNKKFNTVPQIFIGDKHIGGYTDLVKYLKAKINFDRLEEICEILVRNLNKVIDINFYPVVETSRSNFRSRPLGIGVQGYSDMLFKLGIPFESDENKLINRHLFEAIQYFCLKASCKMAKEREEVFYEMKKESIDVPVDRDLDLPCLEYKGQRFTQNELRLERYPGAYLLFDGSPLSRGEFQWEKCGVSELFMGKDNWENLRQDIMRYGVRNSLLTALMPTASTSQILGNNECFEPITSNIYTRRTLAGDFVVLNKYLVRDLIRDGYWSRELKDMIVAENGSVSNLTFLPDKTRELYKTVWEIKQKCLIDLSADRTPFICQTQSLNLFFEEPKVGTLGSALIYGWKRGLKTGSYYIRSRPKVQAQQFTVDPKLKDKMNNYEVCESCSG